MALHCSVCSKIQKEFYTKNYMRELKPGKADPAFRFSQLNSQTGEKRYAREVWINHLGSTGS